MFDVWAQTQMPVSYEQALFTIIAALVGYLTHKRIAGQDSGWSQLVSKSNEQVSNLQRTVSDQARTIDRLQRMLFTCRHEAVVCPQPHPEVERWDTDEISIEDVQRWRGRGG